MRTTDEILEECLREQDASWARGERIPVESFILRYEQLRTNDLRLDLIFAEHLLREMNGETVPLAEYITRFPDLAGRIETMFKMRSHFMAPQPKVVEVVREREAKSPLTLTRYAQYQWLGRGGMGTVYRARDLDLERDVAIKILNSSGDELGWASKLRKEAGTVARLQHPNIVQIFDVGEDEGRPYLVFEFISGGTLAERLKTELLPADAAAAMIRSLALALQVAHEHHIVHRDIKPANILLQSSDSVAGWTPKLTDFGLAKLLDSRSESRSGEFVGSVHYMAPEQATGEALGPTADIYSLGVIFYECVTGRPPYQGVNPLTVLTQAAKADPVPPRRLRPELSRDLEAVILKCLNADPKRRYPTAQAFADDIDRYLAGRPTHARPLSLQDAASKWVRRNPLAAGLATAAILILIAGISGVVWQWRKALHAQESSEQALLSEADQRRKSDLNLYSANISQALLFWDSGEAEKARTLVADLIPGEGQIDYRGWEWHYLNRLVHSETRKVVTGHWCNAIVPMSSSNRYATAIGIPRMSSLHKPEPKDGQAAVLDLSGTGVLQPGPVLPSGATVVAVSAQRELIVWGTPTGDAVIARTSDLSVIRTVHVKNDITGLGFYNQGHTLLVGDMSGTATAFNVDSGVIVRTEKIWERDRCLFAITPDQKTVLFGGAYRIAKLVNLSDWTTRHQLPNHEGQVCCVACEADGKTALTGSTTGMIYLWDFATGKELRRVKHQHGAVYSLAGSPDGIVIASAGSDHNIRVWDRNNGRIIAAYRGHTAAVRALAYSSDGSELLSGSQDGTIRTWNARQNPRGLHVPFDPSLNSIWASVDGDDLIVRAVKTQGEVKSWIKSSQGTTRELIQPIPLTRGRSFPINYTSFVNSGHEIAGIPKDNPNCVAVWDLETGRELRRSTPANGIVTCVSTNNLGSCIVWSTLEDSQSSLLHVWKHNSTNEMPPQKLPTRGVQTLGVNDDTNQIVVFAGSATNDNNSLLLCSVTSEASVHCLATITQINGALAFSRNGKLLAVAADRHVDLYAMPDAKLLQTIPNMGSLTSMTFSPDHQRLATIGYDGIVSLIHLETCKVLFQLQGLSTTRPEDRSCDARVVFTDDGKTLISTNWDGSLNIWNAR